jgi:hypothetical protein
LSEAAAVHAWNAEELTDDRHRYLLGKGGDELGGRVHAVHEVVDDSFDERVEFAHTAWG